MTFQHLLLSWAVRGTVRFSQHYKACEGLGNSIGCRVALPGRRQQTSCPLVAPAASATSCVHAQKRSFHSKKNKYDARASHICDSAGSLAHREKEETVIYDDTGFDSEALVQREITRTFVDLRLVPSQRVRAATTTMVKTSSVPLGDHLGAAQIRHRLCSNY